MASTLFGATGVDGNGWLTRVTFSALIPGVVDFSFSRVLLGNSNLDAFVISNADCTPGQMTMVAILEPASYVLWLLGSVLVESVVRRGSILYLLRPGHSLAG